MRYDADKVRWGLGQVFRDERKRHNITQIQLAEIAGISRNSIATAETRGTMMNMDTIIRICNALDVNIDELFRKAQGDEICEK